MALALDLSGRVVLVTGGTRGIGLGITEAFRAAGARVLTCSRSEVDATDHYVCDVRDPDAVQALVAQVVADAGRLDVLVNNAGGAPYALAADASARFHDKIVGLNLLGAAAVCAGGQRRDAAAGDRRRDRQHLLGLRGAALARHARRTARRRPGSTRSPPRSPSSGGRRSGSTRSTSACAAPRTPPTTTAATRRWRRSSGPSRSAGWPGPRRSGTSPSSSPATSRRTSPALGSSATAGASPPSSCPPWKEAHEPVGGSRRDRHRCGPRHRPGARARAGRARRGRRRQRLRRLAVRPRDTGESPADEVVAAIDARRVAGRSRTAPTWPTSSRPPRWCSRRSTPSAASTSWSTTPASSATGCSSTPPRRSGTR